MEKNWDSFAAFTGSLDIIFAAGTRPGRAAYDQSRHVFACPVRFFGWLVSNTSMTLEQAAL